MLLHICIYQLYNNNNMKGHSNEIQYSRSDQSSGRERESVCLLCNSQCCHTHTHTHTHTHIHTHTHTTHTHTQILSPSGGIQL